MSGKALVKNVNLRNVADACRLTDGREVTGGRGVKVTGRRSH